MKSAVSYNQDVVAQEACDAARDAARRAGLSMGEWLRVVIDSAAGDPPVLYAGSRAFGEGNLGSIKERLDELSSRLGAQTRSREEAPRTTSLRELETRLTGLAQNISRLGDETPRRIADSITRLNGRLDHLIVEGRTASSEFERRIAAVDNALAELGSDPMSRLVGNWSSVEEAAAEIEARQRAIETEMLADAGLTSPAMVGLEQQLRNLTRQMEGLRRPPSPTASTDAAVADLRRDLSQISRKLSEAMPRQAVEALESEVQWLATRVNDGRRRGNETALAGVERSLSKVYDAIASLAPAESLEGIEYNIEELEHKIDLVAATGPTPAAMRQLENAVSELRALSGKVASGQALDNLADEVRSLTEKIDRFVDPYGGDVGFDVTPSANPGPIERDLAKLRADYLESNRQARATLDGTQNRETVTAAEPAGPIIRPIETKNFTPPPAPQAAAATSEPPASAKQAAAPQVTARKSEAITIKGSSPASGNEPLEPGSGTPAAAITASAAERIATSEAALGSTKSAKQTDHEGRSNFIAAARRAAQAAASEAVNGTRVASGITEGENTDTKTRKRRVTLFSVGAILLLAGTSQLATNFLGFSDSALLDASRPGPQTGSSGVSMKSAVAAPSQRLAKASSAPAANAENASAPNAASHNGPAAALEQRQMSLVQATDPLAFASPAAGVIGIGAGPEVKAVPNPSQVTTISIQPTDVTGSAVKPQVTAALPNQPAAAPIDVTGSLPESIGSARLRAAAAAGDPAAEFEIAVRYAEGKGIPTSLEQAARWFERAANQGLAPAQYRLGSLYEKGRGVKKDLPRARALYQTASDKGNGKAMHNLAVLYAEGIDGKPDYKTAVQWFHKAASRGVADSQYNLGILYARGIGVEQSLPESYKWFMLAAQQGDPDAGRKRDDVAGRLDPQSLVAAKLAAQTFTNETQPEEAVSVRTPAGGWDRVGTSVPAAPATPAKTKTTGAKKSAT